MLASIRHIHLIRHLHNLGFPAAANSGILAAGKRDILLLNSDTLVPPGAIEAIIDAAYARPDIGTATPFSNEATILSYPRPVGRNAMPDLAGAAALQALAAKASDGQTVEIPTCIGSCVLLRHDCVAATGSFRSDIFAQGYGEENDFSLRARHLGYRHVAATAAFVAHQGSVSFRSAGRTLNARNARILNRIHPGYDQLIAGWIKTDPLAAARHRLDLARFKAGTRPSAILLISHNHGGGVARKIAHDMDEIRARHIRPLLLVPGAPDDPKNTPFPWDAQLTDGPPEREHGLRFNLPAAMPALLDILRDQNVQSVVLHHGLGHHHSVRGIADALGVPQDIILHDYASFCPRVTLLTKPTRDGALRYCGEPNLAGCTACVAIAGDETFENLGPARLVERSAAEFAGARRIIAPSNDTARRIHRHFPSVNPEVTPWEDDKIHVQLHHPGNGPRRVIVIGGIGPAKGFDLLIECANDAKRRNLDIDFIVAGASARDEDLMATGRIFVTGAYAEGEATKLVSSLAGDIAFLPSIWPETWCFALSEAWRAGLYVLAFDLGAQAARIKATNRGAVLPFGLPASRVNDILLAWQPDPRA
jgi:GT2 family glycosyltransferase